MTYLVQVGERLLEVSVEGEDGGYAVTLGDQSYHADLRKVGQDSLFSLLIEGRSFEVHVAGGPQAYDLQVDGVPYTVQVAPRTSAGGLTQGLGAEQAGPLHIQAPMPGVVNEVYVQPQQAVERGARLLVLEAMKMNNEIQAPRAGTVQEVRVSKGQRVNKGDVLLVLA